MIFTWCVMLLLVGMATGQMHGPCSCGAVIITDAGEVDLYPLPEISIHGCHNADQCSMACALEYDQLSNGGDLNYVTSSNDTVGQVLCDSYGHPVDSEYVYGYFQICSHPWEYTGTQSNQPLCCDEFAMYYEC